MSATFGADRMRREVRVSADALRFVSAMLDAAGWSASDLHYFIEKPWKWADEYAMWLNNGKPTAGDEAFPAFVALMVATS